MSKSRLIADLEAFNSHDIYEEGSKHLTIQFLEEEGNNFCCSNLDGHITGTGVVVNKERTHLLVIFHKASGGWWVPGGHSDGESITQKVAKREVEEETGLTKLKPLSPLPFDVGVHPIAERKDKKEPEHIHYDIRYLFEGDISLPLTAQVDEVDAAKWVTLDEALKLNDGSDMKRMLAKIRALKV